MNENINDKGSQTIAVEDSGHSIFYYEEQERLTEPVCFIGWVYSNPKMLAAILLPQCQ
ncbi:MAG: hypothetical protein M3146_03190 [Thermoproteota archaeon]|nr:hypothetical protein [Thermoproteota archaeon]